MPAVLNMHPVPHHAPLAPLALSQNLLAEARELTPSAVREFDALAAQLRDVNPWALEGDAARFAFWLNTYNALIKHALFLRQARGHLWLHLSMFDRVAYRVGGADFTPNIIEHGLLRHNRRGPGALFRTLSKNSSLLRCAPSRFDPRIHFALNCGAVSCPPIRAYQADAIDAQFDVATASYVAAETRIDRRKYTVYLPGLCRLYSGDFGGDKASLALCTPHLDEDDRQWLKDHGHTARIAFTSYNWRVTGS